MTDVRVYSDEESDSKSSTQRALSGTHDDDKDRKSRAFVACRSTIVGAGQGN